MLGQKCQANTRKLPTTLENNIYQRIAQLSQILANNSTLLTKAAPSQKQLKQILQHTYNCYDQLDFIYLDYSKHPIHYLDPKALAQNTQKIFRSTKCLLRHLQYSYDTFSIQIIQKANQVKPNVQQHNCTSSHCFICLKNINEMKLKEAKESILGPAQWRKIYQEELRLEQQELKKQEIFQKREDKQEYVSSVNFLAGIIKEMEDSAKNYEKLAQSVQRQNANEEHTVFVLQELIGKLKVKLGDKYKFKFQNKLKSMLKKMEEKNNSLIVAHQMTVTQQFNLKIEKGEHKARASGIFVQETILHKLKEENKRLIAQRNEFYDKLQHLKESEQKLETSGSFSRSVFKKKTLEAKYQKTEEEKNIGGEDRNTLSEKIENQQKSTFQQHILQNISPLSTKKGKKKIVGRMSAFHLKRIQTRNSQLSALVAKSIQEDNVEQESEQQHEGKEQQINIFDSKNSSLRNPQAEKTYKIQIGCQWEQSFCELANGKQVATVKSGSKKNKPAMNRAQKENEESMSTNKNRKSKLESLKNIIPTLDTKTLVADNVLPRYNSSDSHYLRDQRSALQLREDHLAQDHARLHPQKQVDSINFEQRREDKKIKAVRVFKNVQDDLKNKNSHKKNRLAHEKALRTSKDNLGVLINTGKLQTNLQTKNNLTLDQIKVDYSRDEKMNYLKARVVTEQSLVSKKEKMIRNVVFKPEHLTIFGGVSESYNYQNWKTDFSIEKLTKDEQQTLQGLKDFIQNLKSFKNGLYENIVCFLNRPFSLIQKNEDGFRPLKSQWAEKLLVKIFLFHRKKCGSAICGHLRQFCGIIGYYLKE